MKKLKIEVTILVLVSQIAFIQGMRLYYEQAAQQSTVVNPAKTKGNPKAAVHVIEYTDFQCPACATGARILREYGQRFPGKLYVEYRNFPLDMHKNAMSIAVAAECAAKQKKFWPFHDAAFSRQNLLRETINLPARLGEIAQETGIKAAAFEACQKDPAVTVSVKAEKQQGEAQKVQATPTYFVNGKMFVGIQALTAELQSLIGRLP